GMGCDAARLIRSAQISCRPCRKTPFPPSWTVGRAHFVGPRVASATLRRLPDMSRFSAVFGEQFAVPQCDKSTSFPNVVSTALNITLEARRTACFNHAHEHDPHRSPPRQAVRCKGDCGNA